MTPSIRIIACAGMLTIITLGGCATRSNRGLDFGMVELPEASAPATARNSAATATNEAAAAAEAPVQPAKPAASASPSSAARPLHPGEQVFVDGLLGQISGRPMFIDNLLAPLADQLRSERARTSQREFIEVARNIINRHLFEMVLNELVLAEAEASLTEQEQQGLLYWLRHLQERTIAQGRGVRVITERRLLEEEGKTMDEYLEGQKQIMLIRKVIDQKINPRVIVSWRDVQREYERRRDEFNPPATVTLKRIALSNRSQPELIEQVKQQLGAGESFDVVGESIGAPAFGTLDPLVMGPGGISDVPINDAYKPFLQGLSVGDTSAPIDQDGRTVWLNVAAVDQPPHRTLYDVQRQLLNELTARRYAEQRDRYFTTLQKSVNREDMERRLLVVAVMRYGQ